MPPGCGLCENGLVRIALACVVWQVAHNVISSCRTSAGSSASWIEWQLRQCTVAEFA